MRRSAAVFATQKFLHTLLNFIRKIVQEDKILKSVCLSVLMNS